MRRVSCMIVLVVLRRNSCFYKKDELVLGQSVKKAPYRKQGSPYFFPFDSLLNYSLITRPEGEKKGI